MDGNGSLFGTLCGNTRNVLQKFTVDLPKKHGEIFELAAEISISKEYLCFKNTFIKIK